ncbi:MAG: hypothetical protein AAGH38_08855, partial [Pseudomonadota bacterium]
MATYEQVMEAARQADAAGDSADAKRLLEIAGSMGGQSETRAVSPETERPRGRLHEGSKILMEDDRDGIVYQTPSGRRGYTSPAYSTIDPQRVDDILEGQPAGIDRTTLEAIMADYVEPVTRYPTIAAEGVATGVGNLAGLLGDALNASPMIGNLPRGTQGIRPLSQIKEDPDASAFEKGIEHSLTFLPGFGHAIDYLTDAVPTEDGDLVLRGGGQNINQVSGNAFDMALKKTLGIERDGPLKPRNFPERLIRRV